MQTHNEEILLQRSIYFGAVLGGALWVVWIGWMPFIKVCLLDSNFKTVFVYEWFTHISPC